MIQMFSKDKIVLELDERYFNQYDLRNAVVEHLRKEGKSCEVIDGYTLIVNNKKYVLTEKNISMGGVPLQQAILTEKE
jgi:hypothetical protein